MKPRIFSLLVLLGAPLVSGENPPVPPRPPAEVLLLGTFHFSDSGLDSYKPEHDVDILSEERQGELLEVLNCLERFGPTKVALEVRHEAEGSLNERFRSYLTGERELSSNEIDQIGFRLARRMRHERVFAIDAERRLYEPFVDPTEYAIEHGQAERLVASETPWEEYYAALYSYRDALKMRQSLREHFLYLNDEATVKLTHGHYLVGTFKAGTGNEYPGVDAKVAWYNRNLRIFANIQRMTESPDDRILVVIGSGHVPLLRHAIESSPEYTLVEVADVFADGCGQPAIRKNSRTSVKE